MLSFKKISEYSQLTFYCFTLAAGVFLFSTPSKTLGSANNVIDRSTLLIETKILRRLSPFATTVDLTSEKTFYNNDNKVFMVTLNNATDDGAELAVRFEVIWPVMNPEALESDAVELTIIRDFYKDSEQLQDLTSIWTVKLKRNALHLLKYKQTKLDRDLGLNLQLTIQ